FALALSGYFFSLIGAGHIFIFDMMPWVMLLMTGIEKALRTGSLFYLALSCACVGEGLSAGVTDQMLIFVTLILAHAVFRLFRLTGKENRPLAYIGRRAAGSVLGILFLGLTASQTLYWLSDGVMDSRQDLRAQAPADRETYATSWSFPPAELIETIAPGYFGTYTRSQTTPYWGAIGRLPGWEEAVQNTLDTLRTDQTAEVQNGARQQWYALMQTRNYREHTVYLGVIPIVFACFAAGAAFRRKAVESLPDVFDRREIFFWLIALLLSVLLAFGRYFPLHNIYLQLPLFNQMRAPIKFLHLAELSLCLLFAFGFSAFLQHLKTTPRPTPSNRLIHVFGIGIMIVAAWMLISSATMIWNPARWLPQWEMMGLGGQQNELSRNMAGAVAQGALAFFVCGLCFFRARAPSGGPRLIAGLSLLLLVTLALDLGLASRRFVITRDLSATRMQNPVSDIIRQHREKGRTAVVDPSFDRGHWLYGNLVYHGVDLFDPHERERPDADYELFTKSFGENSVSAWNWAGVRYLIGPTELLAGFV
ncbi:MAG: hypothetical protein AAF492_18135, partial [Verrucomicrobiota bacterium]